jgi:general stress protein 26
MNSTRPKLTAGIVLMLSFVFLPQTIRTQVKPAPRLDRESLLATAREIMKTARYCALITIDSHGRPRARTMDPFSPDENLVVWLGTNAKSHKVAEIRRHQRVTLYYFARDDQAYVTITGHARIVSDAAEKARHWKEEWKDFYPDGRKSYLLIEVTPERLEVISVKLGIVGDSVTWTPPALTFKHRRMKSGRGFVSKVR